MFSYDRGIKPGYVLVVIAVSALFFGSGVLMILLAASLDSFHSLWTVLLDCFALLWPTMCGGCDFQNMYDERNSLENMKDLGFFLSGGFLVSGFILPIYLHHIRVVSLVAAMLSIGGGTCILAAVMIFLKYFVIKL